MSLSQQWDIGKLKERVNAEILGDPYHKKVPLPRIPNYRALPMKTRVPVSVAASILSVEASKLERITLREATTSYSQTLHEVQHR